MKIQIKANGRPFAGAKEPKFNAKCINESKFGEYGLRFKECNAWLDVDAKEGVSPCRVIIVCGVVMKL